MLGCRVCRPAHLGDIGPDEGGRRVEGEGLCAAKDLAVVSRRAALPRFPWPAP
jgi:hypothetical protein